MRATERSPRRGATSAGRSWPTIVRCEISKDVRAGPYAAEATAAFCDAAAALAEPLLEEAREARAYCHELAAAEKLQGWWDAICR